MPVEDSYRRQVELLVKALPSVAQEPCFAVKGGAAINLFVRDGVVLSPRRTDLSDVYRNHLFGMLNEPVSLDTLYETREALVEDIVGNMPDNHRQFLTSFEKGQPDWDLLEVKHAKTLPAVRWRMLNLARVSDEQRTQLVSNLEAALGASPVGMARSRRRSDPPDF